jgi:hypothetical protein
MENILEPLKHFGKFWLPDKGKRVPGSLEFTVSNGVVLHLHESFPIAHRQEITPLTSYIYDEIVGFCDDGLYIALIKCGSEGPAMRFASGLAHSEKIFSRNPLIKYYKCKSEHPLADTWTSLRLSLPGLAAWLGSSPIITDSQLGQVPKSFSISYQPPTLPIVLAETADWTLGINYAFKATPDQNCKSTMEYNPYLYLDCTSLKLTEFFMHKAFMLRCFFALLTRKKICYTDFRVGLPRKTIPANRETPEHKIEQYARLYFHQPHFSDTLIIRQHEFLLKYTSISTWSEILKHFLTHYCEIGHIVQLLMSVTYEDHSIAEYRLLAMIQALEGFHRVQFSNSIHCSKDEYKTIRKSIKGKIDELSSIEEPLCSSIGNCLDHANEFSLLDRLRELSDELSSDVRDALCGNWDTFLRRIRDFRHNISHQLSNRTYRDDQLYWDSVRCELWLTLLILMRSGISDLSILDNLRTRESFQLQQMKLNED